MRGLLPIAALLSALLAAPVAAQTTEAAETTFPGGYRLRPLAPSERLDVGGDAPLSLGQVLASVERHHPTVAIARAGVSAAEGERLAAEGGFDLTLTGQGWGAPVGYYDWARADVALTQPTPLWGATVYAGWRIGRGGDIPDYYGNHETLDLGEVRAGVTVPLWRDGPIDARRARLWRAEHATRAEQAGLEARMLRLRLDAAQAFWAWVAAGQKYRVAEALLDLAETRDAQIAARVAAGAIPPIESLENRRVIVARRTSLVATRRSLERAAIALSMFYRSDDGAPRLPSPRRVPIETASPPAFAVEIPREVRGAWERRPETERYRALVARQRVAVDHAENQLAPRIDVSLGASVDLGAAQTPARQDVLGQPVLEGGVLVSLPFQLREARGGIQARRAELGALEAEAQLLRDAITTEVRDAASAVRAAEQGVALATEAAEVAEAVAEAERRRFELGDTQLFVVNLREEAAAAARAVLVDAENALRLAHAQWAAVTGRIGE